MSSLFMVMLGGRHAKANIEVHDVVFAQGDELQETYPQLRTAWFGEQEGLHIDAWHQINGLECSGKSYRIQFSDTASTSSEKLYLINLGGYDFKEFGELHRYVLLVAENATSAKQKGKSYVADHWQKAHTDRVLEVDDCLVLDHINGQYLHLIEGSFTENIWENTYLLLNESPK